MPQGDIWLNIGISNAHNANVSDVAIGNTDKVDDAGSL